MKKPLLPIVFVAFAGLGFGALASADTLDFKPAERLDSSKLNARFAELSKRLGSLEASSLAERTFQAKIARGGSVDSATGAVPWISLSAAQQGVTGNYTYTIAPGTFTTDPTCVVTGFDNGSNASMSIFFQIVTKDQMRVQGVFNGQMTNLPLHLICVGK
jgi:hypothetical protein